MNEEDDGLTPEMRAFLHEANELGMQIADKMLAPLSGTVLVTSPATLVGIMANVLAGLLAGNDIPKEEREMLRLNLHNAIEGAFQGVMQHNDANNQRAAQNKKRVN